ncbi:DNA polymerase III subunit delta [Erwinia sp. OLTSP20]|uniref:DNA polymerase III subunit delta n=1 Tax=unclassified Erwinia TaxID=2622719 RepID=UPI000C1A4F46|nr:MULTISPECIES: DNA polymerase III subunit delta [unclassified Erwinia]PIJ48795.1 DNA polymerase III subunit delta [Erwinia sp. OAMSP11]PIJ69419.1 DNA polymerase III subunit delta [Erwinia sp. OLSSP12]PIJ79253.1 DNA polymerase III subunit delta [Erwinia sp. OLCASP19]PIJ80779.1 DNA polymerase III subunit delta [Erwinia sp. OLMTSP26]PIJ82931.1 DNA polymerase III subunit delta [Erwinia sp. OLMDSP33]
MIRIYPEQLRAQLQEGLRPCYILSGNEPLLLQESQDAIRHQAQQHQFTEHHSDNIDAHTDWDALFASCRELSLFASRQTLTLQLAENGPNAAIAERLVTLSSLLHDDLLLILRCPKLTKAQENSAWYKALSAHAVVVPCQAPEQAHLPRWVHGRAKQLNLQLDDASVQLLCYCYEGNLLALSQALERLGLLWPEGKLTLPRVEAAVNDASHFTPFHWVDALLAGKNKRALHILHQLQQQESEPVIMLRTLQRDLMTLLTLQRQMKTVALRSLFDQYRVWQNRRPLFSEALQRLSADRLRLSVSQLTRIELILKQDYGQSVWSELETLTLMLCHPGFPEDLVHDG